MVVDGGDSVQKDEKGICTDYCYIDGKKIILKKTLEIKAFFSSFPWVS